MSERPRFILPDEICNQIEALKSQEEHPRWEIGMISQELVDEFGGTHGKSIVRKAVAVEYGCSTSTVADREGMVRFYPRSLRDDSDFAHIFDVLSYHQLRACKTAGPTRWQEYADWAVESADDFGGRPAPVDAIRKKIKGVSRDDPNWIRMTLRIANLSEDIQDEVMPDDTEQMQNLQDVQKACRLWLNKLDTILEDLRKPAQKGGK